MTTVFGHRLRLLITALYAMLAVIYALIPPIFEKPDEDRHFAFALHLARGNGLPIQSVNDQTEWEQAGSQPPLFYGLASLVIRTIGAGDYEAQTRPNAVIRYDPYYPGAKNKLLITPEKTAFHYRETTLAAIIIRLLGLLPGGLTVWLGFDIALWLTRRRAVALCAMSLIAFNPMFLTISTSVSNDGLVICFSTLSLWLMARSVMFGFTPRRAAALGAATALATLSKLGGLATLPVAMAIGTLMELVQANRGRRRPDMRRLFTLNACLALPIAGLAGWWFVRNQVLYGEWTGTSMMAQVAGPRDIGLAALAQEFEGFRLSFVAVFGQFNIPADALVYRLWDVILVLGLVGLAVGLTRRARRSDSVSRMLSTRDWLALALAGQAAVVLITLIRWTMITSASQGRLWFPSLAALAAFLALGLYNVTRFLHRGSTIGPVAASGLMFVLAVVAPWRYVMPAYAPPFVTGLPPEAKPVNGRLGAWAEVLGYSMSPAVARPGDRVRVRVFLRSTGVPRFNYYLVTRLYGRDERLIERIEGYTGSGLLPSSQWRVGETWADEIGFDIPLDAATPAVLRAQFSLFLPISGETIFVQDATNQEQAALFEGSTLAPRAVASAPVAVLGSFPPLGSLVALSRTEPIRGDVMRVGLEWQTDTPSDRSLSAFIHLTRMGDQTPSAQQDGPPDGGQYPTQRWASGVRFFEQRSVPIPVDLKPGRYRLLVGLYDPVTGVRVSAINGPQASVSDLALVADEFEIP